MPLTAIPTAAGREHQVISWVEAWVAQRPALAMQRDDAGNLLIGRKGAGSDEPLVVTAHMDHPAFVVESVGREQVELSFRGSVNDPYFEDARIELFTAGGDVLDGRILQTSKGKPFRRCSCQVSGTGLSPGDIGRWALPEPALDGDIYSTHACDDLAALAAALAALDRLCATDATPFQVLLTRAEEIGFVGATAACRLGTIPPAARVVTLENSRSFAESPIGGGPIVRVGDRRSTFSPDLTQGIVRVAEQVKKQDEAFRYQRRLMPGGSCESTVFGAYGFQATCLCLPLGNYHNQADLDAFERGDNRHPRPGREFISVNDYHGLIELLVGCCLHRIDGTPDRTTIDRLHDDLAWVLEADHEPSAS